MTRLLIVVVVLGVAAGCGGASASVVGISGATTGGPRSQGRAPLSVPWSQVRIVGGSPPQHVALRRILRGFGRTALRTIRITAPLSGARSGGSDFSYLIAAPKLATHQGILGFQGEWEAAMVGESYAAIQHARRLPQLRWQEYSDLLPDGKTVGLSGMAGTDYRGQLQTLPSESAIRTAVHRAARQGGFHLLSLGFVHPYRTLPVIIVSIHGHTRLRRRLDGFLAHLLPSPQVNLAYIQLDTSCGRPVFARGQGVAIDPHWFSICDFSAGCPTTIDGSHPPRLTYPC
jgi:hypothetical protein